LLNENPLLLYTHRASSKGIKQFMSDHDDSQPEKCTPLLPVSSIRRKYMPGERIHRKVHEELHLEGVSAKFFYDSQLCYHHGHDNALNNKTILYILKRLAER
jgi:hypothetical protein